MIHLPSTNQIKQRSLSAQKPKEQNNSSVNVPALSPYRQEQKRKEDEHNRVMSYGTKVDKHIMIAMANAKRAQKALDREIEEISAWLENVDIEIGDLQSKIAMLENAQEKEQHKTKLTKLQEQRKRKALKKMESIEERQAIEKKL